MQSESTPEFGNQRSTYFYVFMFRWGYWIWVAWFVFAYFVFVTLLLTDYDFNLFYYLNYLHNSIGALSALISIALMFRIHQARKKRHLEGFAKGLIALGVNSFLGYNLSYLIVTLQVGFQYEWMLEWFGSLVSFMIIYFPIIRYMNRRLVNSIHGLNNIRTLWAILKGDFNA